MVNLILAPASNKLTNIADLGLAGGEVYIGEAKIPVGLAPYDPGPVGAEVGPAAFDFPLLEVEDLRAVGFKGQDGIAVTHASMYDAQEPPGVGRPADGVHVMQTCVRMFSVSPGLQVVHNQFRGCILAGGVAVEFPLQVCDSFAVGAPARLPGVIGDFDTAGPVDVHVVHISNLASSRSGVNNEAYLRAVRRGVRIHLIDIRRVCEVFRIGAVGIGQ